MPAWLAPLAMGLLSAGGQLFTNKSNAKEAARNRAFQADMSSTAAQRSVQDYTRAGLNPALAYDRTASSPGGAQAIMGNAIESGINSAQSYRRTSADLRIAQQQEKLLQAQTKKTAIEGRNAEIQGNELQRQNIFNLRMQPFNERLTAAETALQEYLLPGAKNQAAWESQMGKILPALNTARSAAGALSSLIPNVRITPSTVRHTIIKGK